MKNLSSRTQHARDFSYITTGFDRRRCRCMIQALYTLPHTDHVEHWNISLRAISNSYRQIGQFLGCRNELIPSPRLGLGLG